jgi:hypothetical protein
VFYDFYVSLLDISVQLFLIVNGFFYIEISASYITLPVPFNIIGVTNQKLKKKCIRFALKEAIEHCGCRLSYTHAHYESPKESQMKNSHGSILECPT